jgi:hypothetical protein
MVAAAVAASVLASREVAVAAQVAVREWAAARVVAMVAAAVAAAVLASREVTVAAQVAVRSWGCCWSPG